MRAHKDKIINACKDCKPVSQMNTLQLSLRQPLKDYHERNQPKFFLLTSIIKADFPIIY